MSILPLLASINWSFQTIRKKSANNSRPSTNRFRGRDKSMMWNTDISGRDFFIH